MKIILDASAALELVLKKAKAEAIGQMLAKAETVKVPDLYVSEVTNVLWKCYAFASLPLPECEAALAAALEMPDDFALGRDLAAEALALSCLVKAPVYDMMYAVLARRSAAELLTLDAKLVAICKQQGIRVAQL